MARATPRHSIVLLAAAVAIGVGGAACSSSSDSGSRPDTTNTPTTTSAPEPAVAAPYAKTGRYAVGFTSLRLAGGRRVVVWYPAKPGSTTGHAQETIDPGGMLSPALQKLVPATSRVKYTANAYADAPPAPKTGGYPVVLFSHGIAGYPEQSLFITTHLASWGFVVAAPNFVDRSLDGLLGIAAAGVPKTDDVTLLQETLAQVEKTSKATGVLNGLVDANNVVAAGHSAGANATYRLASADPRVKAFVVYSVGFGGWGGPAPSAPKQPGMVMLGTTDGLAPPAASEKVYVGMQSPKYLVKVGRAGHLVFTDICLIGRSSGGLVGIAKALKLPVPDSILRLGTDGCTKDHPLPEKAFPAIDQLTVAFFRSELGLDATPTGLDTKAVADLGAAVTVAKN